MFKELFEKIKTKNPEVEMIGIWGGDGLELDKAVFNLPPEVNTELLGAELADVFLRLQKISEIEKKYFLEMIFNQNRKLVIFSLNYQYYILVIASGDLVTNKLKFYIELFRQNFLDNL